MTCPFIAFFCKGNAAAMEPYPLPFFSEANTDLRARDEVRTYSPSCQTIGLLLRQYLRSFASIDLLKNAAAPRWRSVVWGRNSLPMKTLFLVPRVHREHFVSHGSPEHTCVLPVWLSENHRFGIGTALLPQGISPRVQRL